MARRSIRFDDQHLVPAHNLTIANKAFAADAAGTVLVRKKPRDMSVRDWAIYLLHNAAEVEHALMIQYLFAMYSLNRAAKGPAANNASATVLASSWINRIRGIAIEEMGHLLTIQNILRCVGGPMCFDRGDFPIPTDIYPFAFELEPLTKDALAKYVFAEMPEGDVLEEILTVAERADIEQRARTAAGIKHGHFLNHVGTLYATLLDVFADPAFQSLPTAGFPPNTAPFQQDATDFRSQDNSSITGAPSLLSPRVLAIHSLQDVQDALTFIASQGEAASENPTDSHFERFLKIYREFPEPNASGWNIPPTFPVSRNPATAPSQPGSILHPITQLWARLFDVRYRMLLISLVHLTALPVRDGSEATTQKKDALISWIFSSFMLRTDQPLSLSNLAVVLAQMPSTLSRDAPTAGAPFGMPYSLAMPDQEPERWQYHLDLIASSDLLVTELQKVIPQMAVDPLFVFFDNPGGKLAALVDDDALRRTTISAFLEAH